MPSQQVKIKYKRLKKSEYTPEVRARIKEERRSYMREYSKKYYSHRKDKNYRTVGGRYASYKCSARRRGLDFEMSKEQFADLVSMYCTYCGATESLGIDRIDSNRGYIDGNICACCTRCNFLKRDMGVEDFIHHCKRIIEFYKIKK